MDFSKVQGIRESDRKKRLAVRMATLGFALVMGFTFVPKYQTYQLKKTTSVSADSFMRFLSEGKLMEAYEIGLKASLKKQHPYPKFEDIFQNLMLRKGGVISYRILDFVSHPDGKPYELLTYEMIHDRGFSRLDLALEPEETHFVIRAYRIKAAGM